LGSRINAIVNTGDFIAIKQSADLNPANSAALTRVAAEPGRDDVARYPEQPCASRPLGTTVGRRSLDRR
jgi:hypothetical protein